ncbi:MAG: hypothetical protein M3Y45_03945 [Actinomycetota bacterium]|nr:hypothetical protein [Actinomycetota bacterium]
MPVRLDAIERPAPLALLTGDPRRAFALAGGLMVQPRMSHQARGMWGYTGTTAAGLDLTVQSTGTGGPSAAAVFGDLSRLGVKEVVRLGSCVTGPGGPEPGSLLLVAGSICSDGASSALAGNNQTARPDERLQELLSGIAPETLVSSHDLVARLDNDGLPATGAVARDLQTATVFALAAKLGVRAASILIVTGGTGADVLDEAELTKRFLEVGRRVIERFDPPVR